MNDLTPFNEFQKEIAKAFGEEAVKEIFGFINDIIRPPAKELGGLLADQVKYFRMKNQIKLFQKAAKLHKELDLGSQKIPLKLLSHIVDHSSWEENEEMQSKWANLLANASTKGSNTDNCSSHSETLRQLSPQQA